MDFQSLSYFQNLKKADLSGKPDPYVLVNLANGGVKEMKTETIKNNPNPVWNETFRFNVSHIIPKPGNSPILVCSDS